MNRHIQIGCEPVLKRHWNPIGGNAGHGKSSVRHIRWEVDLSSGSGCHPDWGLTSDDGKFVGCVLGHDIILIERKFNPFIDFGQKERAVNPVVNSRQDVYVIRNIRPAARKLDLVATDQLQ
ncbi:MAG TPA: hypothetical protein PLB18_02780 [Acidobacteriota bacterium]|nr:hypothetical protein [Acidobacteriota bacterium]